MTRVMVGLVGLNLIVSTANNLRWPQSYAGITAPLVLALVAALCLWSAVTSLRPRLNRWPMTVLVALCYLTLALHPILLTAAAPPYPPLLHVLGAGMCATGLAFGTRPALVLVPGYCLLVAAIRSPRDGLLTSLTEGALLLLSGALSVALVHLVRKSAQQATDAVHSAWTMHERAVCAQREAAERARWDRLVHDKVLGALLIAGRTRDRRVPQAARELAVEALAALEGRPVGPQRTALESWQSSAGRHGLMLVTELLQETGVREEVLRSVIAAGDEALTNIARHSGQTEATISGVITPERVAVLISDRGTGFDLAAPTTRSGLRASIRGRMRAIGGDAEVSSAPAQGTRVSLSWSHPPTESPPVARRPPHLFTPVMIMAGVVCLANIALGARHWASASPLNLAGIGGILLVTIAAVVVPQRIVGESMTTVIGCLTTVGLAAVQVPDPDPNWRYWYIGAITPAFAIMAYRFRRWRSLAWAVLSLVASSFIAQQTYSQSPLAMFLGSAPVFLGSIVAGQLTRGSLDRSWAIVTTSAKETGELRLAMAASESRATEASRRTELLSASVGRDLDRLVEGTELTREFQQRLLLAEASLRDQLTAPSLLEPALLRALTEARRRGVAVDVASFEDNPVAAAAAGVRELIRRTLAALEPPATARISWRPHSSSARLTITCVGRQLGDLASVWRATAGQFGIPVTITEDEDCLMVEIP